jgi:enamine deaminase RidA (YjgF/YER057c/UK114 family)
MSEIERWQGQATGRNRAVAHDNIVYTVATAGAPGRDIREQTRLALAAIDKSLADAGSNKTRLLSVQIFLEDMDQKAAMDEVWCDWLGPDWRNWPQRACVGAKLSPDTLVEIVVTAAKA